MQRLVPLLRTMVESCTKGILNDGYFESHKARVWGVVIDFMSLPQRGYTSGYVPDEIGLDGKVIKMLVDCREGIISSKDFPLNR